MPSLFRCFGELTIEEYLFFFSQFTFCHDVVYHNLASSFCFFFREYCYRLFMFYQVPLSHISETVYKTSVDWINRRSPEALSSFLLWSLDSILADLGSQQTVTKGSKKAVQQVTSKSQVTYTRLLCHETVVVFCYFKFLFVINKIQ